MQRIPPELTVSARQLRRVSTDAERRLWLRLRTFRPRLTRQLVIDRFIVDLACRTARVAIERDGSHHAEQMEADAARTRYLEANGWIVLRFWNNDVLENMAGVADTILAAVARVATHLQPLPLKEGRLRSPRRG